jgi:hypothetical protein
MSQIAALSMRLRSSYSAPHGWICAGAALAAALLLGKDVRLDKLLEKISERSSIPMFSDNAGAERMSIAFQNLLVDEGLQDF